MKKVANGRFTIIPNFLVMDKNLDVFEFRILTYLICRSDRDNFCYPSYSTIEKDLKISRSKIIGAIKKLKKLKYITVENRIFDNDRQTSNGYTVSVLEGPLDSVSENPTGIQEKLPTVSSKTPHSVSDVPKQYTSNNNHSLNNHHLTIKDILENTKLNKLHIHEDRILFETAIRKMYSSKHITVNGEIVSQSDVRTALQNMDYEAVADAFETLRYNSVSNKIPYLISVIYNLLTAPYT